MASKGLHLFKIFDLFFYVFFIFFMFGIFFALVPMLELEIAVYINSHDFDPGAGEWCRWKGPSAILRCVAMHYEIVRRQSTRKQALQLLLLTD